ncbi:MAG: hypothetical protein COA67_10370 [Lutibacter sp.]|nr:MAG: hypothetical protein COA67_10370 [Lutibacter sp.]
MEIIKTDFKDIDISIQLRSDGFSFCILDKDSKESIVVQDCLFENENITPQKQLDFFVNQFETNELLKNSFTKVNVTHSNNLSTFVPLPFFNEDNLSEYLQYNLKVLENEFIAYDTIESAEMINVYIPFVHLNNYLFDRFGSFDYKHSSSVLVETLLKETLANDKTHFFVNVETGIFQIVVLKNKKMKFFNTFNFKTKEDFIYYILFTAEQLNLNPEEFQLTLLGDIEKESELYDIIYKYIKNIHFFLPNYMLSKDLLISNHSHFTLLNQH